MEMIANGFERTLREVRNGAALTELTEALNSLVVAVGETGKAGELTFKLKIKPASVGDGTAKIIKDDITVKLPKMEQAQTIMFATEDGALQRNDPRQKEFQLKAVPAPETKPEELRRVVNG